MHWYYHISNKIKPEVNSNELVQSILQNNKSDVHFFFKRKLSILTKGILSSNVKMLADGHSKCQAKSGLCDKEKMPCTRRRAGGCRRCLLLVDTESVVEEGEGPLILLHRVQDQANVALSTSTSWTLYDINFIYWSKILFLIYEVILPNICLMFKKTFGDFY